ncbi:MAG: hypothetical protein ACP5M4_13440 [Acidobacteriaceae bacterium]
MRESLMSVSANRMWRQLPEEIRISASKLFWATPNGTGKQVLSASLAKAKNIREVTVRKAPIERLANWTAGTLSLPEQVVDELLKNYLLHEHRAVIVSFLELLKIPHADGMIDEAFDLATLSDEQVQKAARSLLRSTDRMGAVLYLKYLVLQGGPWAPVEEVLAREE